MPTTLFQFLLCVTGALILAFGIYFPRHRRPDMLVGYLVLAVGVAALCQTLSATSTLGTGFGLGLFGVLSIIRLRSSEIAQQDVAYSFAALAIGLIGGLSIEPLWLSPLLVLSVLSALFVGDHPYWYGHFRQQIVVLDTAVTDENELRQRLEALLGGPVVRLHVRRLDLADDTTTVDVRYRVATRAR